MRLFFAVMIALTLMVPLPAFAVDQGDLLKKIEDLTRELDKVKQQMQEIQKKADDAKKPSWIEIGGVPSNLRQNKEYSGNSGVPALLVDYAFDGMTLGVASDIDIIPGAYAKLCYGRALTAA